MKILYYGNMANDAYSACKGMRMIGADAHVSTLVPSHICSLPQWEDSDVDLSKLGDNPYDPNFQAFNPVTPPLWFNYFKWTSLAHIDDAAKNYDVVIGGIPFGNFYRRFKEMGGKAHVPYDAGWIRYMFDKSHVNYDSWNEARESYMEAKKIIYTNVDTPHIFAENGIPEERLAYSPFAIDTERYRPLEMLPEEYEGWRGKPYFYLPTRPKWSIKATDRAIEAFAAYHEYNPSSRLKLTRWNGEQPNWHDQEALIDRLEIRGAVDYLPVLPKKQFVQVCNATRAVLDQFTNGALGLITPEALACGSPVLAHAKREMWNPTHGSTPPVVNVSTTDEIYQAMIRLEDKSLRKRLGKKGRRWVYKTCSLEVVARKHLQLCRDLAPT